MDVSRRRELARRALEGYVRGPEAATTPTELARARLEGAGAVVLVEGVSDQIAVEATAERLGRDLERDGVLVFPAGGAHAFGRAIEEVRVGTTGRAPGLAILCDRAEEPLVRRIARGTTGLAVHVCVEDLEDELLRAVGHPAAEDLLSSQGDLASFRRMQAQPAWREGDLGAQLRRFLGAGASRKLRYARLLVGACPRERLPAPLVAAAST